MVGLLVALANGERDSGSSSYCKNAQSGSDGNEL
jgi:hypothetical protein